MGKEDTQESDSSNDEEEEKEQQDHGYGMSTFVGDISDSKRRYSDYCDSRENNEELPEEDFLKKISQLQSNDPTLEELRLCVKNESFLKKKYQNSLTFQKKQIGLITSN